MRQPAGRVDGLLCPTGYATGRITASPPPATGMPSPLSIRDAMSRKPKNRRRRVWRPVAAIPQELGLDPEQIGLDRGGPPQAPQQGSQAKHEFALNRSAGVVVRNDSCFETAVVADILDHLDDGFGAQTRAGRRFAATDVCRLGYLDRCFGWRCADWLRFVGSRSLGGMRGTPLRSI